MNNINYKAAIQTTASVLKIPAKIPVRILVTSDALIDSGGETALEMLRVFDCAVLLHSMNLFNVAWPPSLTFHIRPM